MRVAVLNRVVKVGLIEKVAFEQDSKVGELAMWESGRRVFQAGGSDIAKALRKL